MKLADLLLVTDLFQGIRIYSSHEDDEIMFEGIVYDIPWSLVNCEICTDEDCHLHVWENTLILTIAD